MAAEDCGREVRQRLAGARASLGEQHAATAEDAGDGGCHLALPGPRLEVRHGPRERAVVGERARDEGV
jgi:hypothetical protein